MTSNRTHAVDSSLRRIANAIAAPLGALASLSTLAIMVAIFIDVLSRNSSGRSVPGLLEMSETALVATVFLGLAYAGVTNAHVAVDLLTERLPAKVSRVLIGLAWLVGVAITLWFLVSTFERAVQSSESNEMRAGLMDWPLWPARWMVVIGFASFLIVAVINLILIVRGQPLLGEDETDPALAAAQQARLEGAAAGTAGSHDTTAHPDHGAGPPPARPTASSALPEEDRS